MPDTQSGQVIAVSASEPRRLAQRGFQRVAESYEHLFKGLMSIVAQRLELGRGLAAAAIEDFNLLAGIRTPDAFVQAELELLRRRSERAFNTIQTTADELCQVFALVRESVPPGGRA